MLSEDQIEEIARRSLQYIAMYNVINKGAMQDENPMKTGWNGTYAAEGLLDHTMKAMARPDNDTLYVTSILDLYTWSRIELVHGPEGALSMKELSARFSSRQKENLPEMMPLILEASRR